MNVSQGVRGAEPPETSEAAPASALWSPQPQEWRAGAFSVSTDPARIDVAAAHAFLTTSYWAEGIPLGTLVRSLERSLCFGLFAEPAGGMVGLARAISDFTTYAYLCDVYVLEAHRGRGLARWLMQCVLAHPDLQGLRRWNLVTRDAHALYRGLGFKDVENATPYMEIVHRGLYLRAAGGGHIGNQDSAPARRPQEEA